MLCAVLQAAAVGVLHGCDAPLRFHFWRNPLLIPAVVAAAAAAAAHHLALAGAKVSVPPAQAHKVQSPRCPGCIAQLARCGPAQSAGLE